MDPWAQLLRNPTFLRGRATERRREAVESTGSRQLFCERLAADLEQEAAALEVSEGLYVEACYRHRN